MLMHYNKDSESFNCLQRAFEHEACGHVKYTILSDKAEKEGHACLAGLYGRLANEELAHAKGWYEEICGNDGTPEGCLEAEKTDASFTYPRMAAAAELDGYEQLADRFKAAACAEEGHGRLIEDYIADTEAAKRPAAEDLVWRCAVCGCTHTGTTPPKQCPLCGFGSEAFSYR